MVHQFEIAGRNDTQLAELTQNKFWHWSEHDNVS